MANAKKIILLVEDEIILSIWTKSILEKQNYAVETVYTGEDAISRIKEKPDIDLIIMDVDLGPGISGKRAAEIILQEKKRPLIFYTNQSKEEVFEKYWTIDQIGYVSKCSCKSNLLETIERFIFCMQ